MIGYRNGKHVLRPDGDEHAQLVRIGMPTF